MTADIRQYVLVKGVVQGVGFRPHAYRIARALNLRGFVTNTDEGVHIEIEGPHRKITEFLKRLDQESPPLARIQKIRTHRMPPGHDAEFLIRSSRKSAPARTLISPDIATCDACLAEMMNPEDRRFRYPFINCTHCGPRFTIITGLPYDRSSTTMSHFTMCPACEKEYNDPADRRFHAQPNACPVCGPHVFLTDNKGRLIDGADPVTEAVRALESGKIVAVKGLGGFHLACDAASEQAVRRLRLRKHREEKPLAVMAPDTATIALFALMTAAERDLISSPHRPVVLLRKKKEALLAESVAPGNHYIGVMLPYTPLHHLLVSEGFTALIMTSGNISEEPIAADNDDAVRRLGHIADLFLMHNRLIHRRCDDSVMFVAGGQPRFIRRSRGYVPMPVQLLQNHRAVLGAGGELKNTLCLIRGREAFPSQHIGDLENLETMAFFEESAAHGKRIHEIEPEIIACDMHPEYLSTQWALAADPMEIKQVQHHHAHIVACMAENGVDEPVIGLALDGTGYGIDGQIWGGEILVVSYGHFERAGHFAYRSMPGGEAVIREPWRMAVSCLFEACRMRYQEMDEAMFFSYIESLPLFSEAGLPKIRTIYRMLASDMVHIRTSSLGRLFDAVASIAGIRQRVTFEGQAAMALEMAMNGNDTGKEDNAYPVPVMRQKDLWILSPDYVVLNAAEDVRRHVPAGMISRRFHHGIAGGLTEACIRTGKERDIRSVALSGGCFQNRFLLEKLSGRLAEEGFRVYTHRVLPPNDGGLALGQAVVAGAAHAKKEDTAGTGGKNCLISK